MLVFQSILTILILVLFFIKLRIGICFYIAYLFLVPYCKLNIAGISFSWNLLNCALLGAFILNLIKKSSLSKFEFKPYIPFILLYVLLLIEIPFQDSVPFSHQINQWRLALFNLILPLVIWNFSKIDPKLWKYCIYTIVIVSIIIIIYSFYLVPLNGFNPYVMLIAQVNGEDLFENQFGDQQRRLMAKISSVFTHPMTFGAFLGMAAICIFACKEHINKYITYLVLVGLFSCILICGIRTPIAAIFITILIYLFVNKSFKLFYYATISGILAYFIIMQIPEISGTISSIIDSKSSNVGGSSIEMRLNQLNACFVEVQDCLFLGKGYDYTGYYSSKYGIHPTLYSFESIVFVILCNYGLIGFAIWGNMFRQLFNYTNKEYKKNKNNLIIIALMIYYLSYTIITGEYGYIKFFTLFYTIIIISINANNYKKII